MHAYIIKFRTTTTILYIKPFYFLVTFEQNNTKYIQVF